jgi:hypothetical protein
MVRASHRIIIGLQRAEKLAKRPSFIPAGRPRGVKALGVRYERSLARSMPWMTPGQWWRFVDGEGEGWCQTDLIVERGNFSLVLEAKLSWVAEGHSQLEKLYKPVVERALGKPMLGIVVTKYLKPNIPRWVKVEGDFESALRASAAGRPSVWHWLGGDCAGGREAHLAQAPLRG